jgi:ABC-type antimicrobial peptide transport system permease subunit
MSSLDRDLPLEALRTLDEQVRVNIRSDRVLVQLSAAFAILATVLAMLGLYGIMAYSVTRRTREIGIRLALGAPARRIRAMVFSELALILAGGLVVGIPCAIALARVTETRLFGVRSFDPGVVAGAIAALVFASMLAGYIPARRAARIQPGNALRQD